MADTKQQIQEFLSQGEIITVKEILEDIDNKDISLTVLEFMIRIFQEEIQLEEKNTVFDYSLDMDQLAERYVRLKLYIRRLENDLPQQYQEELVPFCEKSRISGCFLVYTIMACSIQKEKVLKRAMVLFQKKGQDSSGTIRSIGCVLEDLKKQK